MRQYKNSLLTGLTALMLIISTGCMELLDKQPETTVTQEQVFGDERRTREFLNNVYSFLPDDFWYISNVGGFSDCMTDNAINTNSFNSYLATVRQGGISATTNPEEWYWSNYYTALRKANKFIENVDVSPVENVARANDDDNLLRDRYKAEARLMRAIYHFELLKRFGKIVIADHTFETNELNPERNEIADVVNFIVSECDEVYIILPFRYKNTVNIGRVDGATALALKSRVLLYAASPLYNTSNNTALWEEAAAAAKVLIERAPGAGIGLMDDFQELFLDQFNKEVILCRNSWETNIFEVQHLPNGMPGSTGFTQPTQNLVDRFEMADGSAFDWNNPVHAANPYDNRDPRFDYSILYHGSQFANTNFDFRLNKGVHDAITGYGVRKWLNPDWDPNQKKARKRTAFIFRYGEVLLNFAEAMNEAYGPDGGPFGSMTARWAVNELRARPTVNMPPYPSGMSKEAFRARIHNERNVELAFEGHRYFDLRRWKNISNMNQLWSMQIVDTDGTISYVRKIQESGTFGDKFYLTPVPYEELIKAPNLGQNPGWEAAN